MKSKPDGLGRPESTSSLGPRASRPQRAAGAKLYLHCENLGQSFFLRFALIAGETPAVPEKRLTIA